MEDQNCSQLEEIPKSQAKISEELFRFKDEISEGIAKFRAQHEEDMADIHSKLDALIDYFRMRSKGIETQLNFSPNGPTILDSSSAIVVEDPIDDKMLEVYEFPDSEGKGDCESEIKHSVIEEKPSSSLVEAIKGIDGMTKAIQFVVPGVDRGMISDQNNYSSILVNFEQYLTDLHLLSKENLLYASLVECKGVDYLTAIEVMFYFDPGGCSSQISCDPFEIDGKLGDNCLKINVDDALVKAKESCAAKAFDEQLEMNGLSLRHVSSFEACKNTNDDSLNVVVLFSNRGSYVTCFSKGALCPLISKASGNKHCHVGSNYFYLFSSAIQDIIVVKVDSGTHEDDFTTVNAKSMFLRVNLWLSMESILAYLAHGELDSLYPIEGNSNVELWFGKMLIFVFDPGLCAISVHILEDKDVFKRVGKRIIPMDITLVIMGRSKWNTNGMFDDNTTMLWKLDKNVNTKVMFIEFVAISLRDLGIIMFDICEDEAVVINSALELHHLPAWSGAFESVLSFVERHNVRKLVWLLLFDKGANEDTVKAIDGTVFKCFLTIGSVCYATFRLLIHVRITSKFLGRLVNWCQDVKVSYALKVELAWPVVTLVDSKGNRTFVVLTC